MNPACSLFLLALVGPLSAAQSTADGTPIPGRPHPAPHDPDLAPGEIATRPDGSIFLVDANQNGAAEALHLVELRWGRRVDVFGLDAGGAIDPRPVLRDFVIGEAVVDDGVNYRLHTNLATQVERLVIQRQPGAPEPSMGAGTFEQLLIASGGSLALVAPKDPAAPPPFSTMARNAVLVARFDDLLRDSPAAAVQVLDNVRLALTPQSVPFTADVFFDPNHGDVFRGKFHSTRVLLDPAITAHEAANAPVPLPVNAAGLPASPQASAGASVVLRLPTRTDTASGQFSVLTNLRGRALDPLGNGPADLGSPTLDVVRGLRSGNESDAFGGYLRDDQPPRLVGEFPAQVTAASPDPAGQAGFAFVIDMTFTSACRLRPLLGNVLEVGGHALEVMANAAGVDPSGAVAGLRVRLQGRQSAAAGDLLGAAVFLTPLRPGRLDAVCWLRLVPTPGAPPGGSAAPQTQPFVRFNEAMAASSVRAFDSFRLVRGDGSAPPSASDVVVAETVADSDLTGFGLQPLVPLDHLQGNAEPYHVELLPGLGRLTDLAGNPVAVLPRGLVFTLDPAAPSVASGGVALSFSSFDELPGTGASDLRGNFFYDPTRGRIRPRPVTTFSVAADRDKPVPGLMVPFPFGVQTPLSPLGSKLHTVWRYADLGWNVRDETKYDLDVAGLSWAPVGGSVISDFYERFEIALAHSRRLPDEGIDANLLPRYPNSGLVGRTGLFTDNVLEDPQAPQKVVHERSLGYQIRPSDAFVAESGTVMMPYPLNRSGGPFQSYTWRDTAALTRAGPGGAGIPMDIEVGPPLFLEAQAGVVAGPGAVPSIGLPLLMEFRCFPTDSGLGLNALDISLAINSSALPAFRSYSTGGFNSSGVAVVKDPDLEAMPSGGFNPRSSPPGQPTTRANENAFYIGQVDLVTRVSRAHSVWIDSGASAPDYVALVLEQAPRAPGPAQVTVELRGADGFLGSQSAPFDAAALDAYGDPADSQVQFHAGQSGWHADWNAIDGARYFQLRFSFLGDVDTGAVAELEGLGVAFLR